MIKSFSEFLNEMAAIPKDMNKMLYHGSNNLTNNSFLDIKNNGFDSSHTEIKYQDNQKSLYKPMQNRIYMSYNIKTAICYAIGGYILNSDSLIQSNISTKKESYLFLIKPNKIEDAIPDEDQVGEFVNNLFTNRKIEEPNSNLNFNIKYKSEKYLTAPQLKAMKSPYCDYDWYIKVGKKLMSYLSDEEHIYIIKNMKNVAALNTKKKIKPYKCYKVNYEKILAIPPNKRKYDSSFIKNFCDLV